MYNKLFGGKFLNLKSPFTGAVRDFVNDLTFQLIIFLFALVVLVVTASLSTHAFAAESGAVSSVNLGVANGIAESGGGKLLTGVQLGDLGFMGEEELARLGVAGSLEGENLTVQLSGATQADQIAGSVAGIRVNSEVVFENLMPFLTALVGLLLGIFYLTYQKYEFVEEEGYKD